jgi:hypothetical protein
VGPEGPAGPQGLQGDVGPEGPQGPAGADGADGGLSNYNRVSGAVSANDSTSPKTVTADCTGGQKVLGGGFVVVGGDPEITAQQNQATDDDTWTVTAQENDPVAGNWTLQAFAVCADAN